MFLFQHTHTSGCSHFPAFAVSLHCHRQLLISLGSLMQHFTSSKLLFLATPTTLFYSCTWNEWFHKVYFSSWPWTRWCSEIIRAESNVIAIWSAPAPQPSSQLQAAAMACSRAASSAQRRHLQVVQTVAFPSPQAPTVISQIVHDAFHIPLENVTPSVLGSRALSFHQAPQISWYPRELVSHWSLCWGKGTRKLFQSVYSSFMYFILEYFNLVSKSWEKGLDSHLTGRCFHWFYACFCRMIWSFFKEMY